MTLVKFLHEKDREGIFAYFPLEIFDSKGNPACYAHIGQHSACSAEYASECKEADYYEYQDLLKELVSIGYKDLVIHNTQAFELHRKPTKGEVKFGEGAIHYKEFRGDLVISAKGELKKYIVDPEDGLRYYR
jgi:hypothetical protein